MDGLTPSSISVEEILGSDPFCVYAHIFYGSVFYIGSGTISRAFEYGPAKRNSAWNDIIESAPVTVRILATAFLKADAQRLEYDLIRKYRPIANMPWGKTEELEWDEITPDNDPWMPYRVRTPKWNGTLVECTTTGRIFKNAKEAADTLGLSHSAVCNSISGRYPEVRGLRFRRINSSSAASGRRLK